MDGWMDYKLMMRWIRKVLVKYTKGRHVLLVFDILNSSTYGILFHSTPLKSAYNRNNSTKFILSGRLGAILEAVRSKEGKGDNSFHPSLMN